MRLNPRRRLKSMTMNLGGSSRKSWGSKDWLTRLFLSMLVSNFGEEFYQNHRLSSNNQNVVKSKQTSKVPSVSASLTILSNATEVSTVQRRTK